MLLCIASLTAYAQSQAEIPITGTITHQNQPLTGATISVIGKPTATVSDNFGKYTVNALPSDVLMISYIGFRTIEIPVDGRTKIDADLREDATTLKEVTINAGYYSVKEKERTGSIARITSKDIERQPVANVLATMQGRMAGVEIIQDTGTPGSAFQIKIRGTNSLRADGNEPLYVIDGVPYASETIGSQETSGHNPTMTSPLNAINPSDIESIEVLKDADATAIYGSRGANGVVLVTTKKGRAGKAVFTVNASTAFGTITTKMDVLDTRRYLAMRTEAFANDATAIPDWAYDLATWSQARNTDWQETLIGGTSEIHSLQASVSGGEGQTRYMLGGNYRSETTVLPGDYRYKKGGAHFALDHVSPDERFRLSFSGGYTAQDNLLPAADLTAVSRTLAPNAPALYDGDGSLNWENSTWDNPLARLESVFRGRTNDLVANTVLSYRLLPSLEAKASLGYTDLSNVETKTMPNTMYNPAYGLGSEYSGIRLNTTTRRSWIAEPQLAWNHGIGKGRLDILAGGSFQQQKTSRLYQSGFGFSSNALIYDLASASIKTVDLSDETIYRYAAGFARVNYNYGGKYIVNITGRRDGSSRFGPGNRFANFGAVGAAWVFSSEGSVQSVAKKWLSFGKLRASYGTTGNDQIGDYQYLDTYSASGNNYNGVVALQPSRLYNPAFGWETNRKLEAALELGFLKDRIFLTLAGYRNRSSDQLVGIPLPATTGFPSLNANLGATVENRGFEVTLRTINIDGNDFKWTTNANLSANRNRLLAFPGLDSSPYATLYEIGRSLNIYKLYHFTGMDTTTGIYQFADANGDGVISAPGDRQAIADMTPGYFGGVQNSFTCKSWQFDFLFQFVKQQAMGYFPGIPGTAVNQPASVANAWQQPGDSATYQPYTAGGNSEAVTAYYRYAQSDAAIVDASYIRLKNISLAYDVPGLKGIKCRLYLQGQNVLLFTPYKLGDPEFKLANFMPPLKVWSAGMQLSF